MSTQSTDYPDDTYEQYTALALIWGDDDPAEPIQYDSSIARVKPPRQVCEPVYIRLDGLEAFREIPTKSRIRQTSDNAADNV